LLILCQLILLADDRKVNAYTCMKYLTPTVITTMKNILKSLGAAERSKFIHNAKAAGYLSSTVRDDARLILLQDSALTWHGHVNNSHSLSVSIEDKARALCSLRLLQESEGDNADVEMEEFLDAAQQRLQEVLQAPEPSQDPLESIGGRLARLVALLQELLVDALVLFFQPHGPLNGLIAQTELDLLLSISQPLNPSSPPLIFPQPQNRHRQFSRWLQTAMASVAAHTRSLLSGLHSANEVAQLQQRTWTCCVSIPDHSHPPHTTHYSQDLWEHASRLLLTKMDSNDPKSTSLSNSSINNGTMNELWGVVFREAFLHQVQRLLRQSCQEVLARTQRLLLLALAGEGVCLDPVTLVVLPWQHVDNTASVGHTTSAATVYVLANRIQQEFEEQVTSLLEDIIKPMQQSAQSAQALTRALRVQSAQLVGQLLVALRLAAEACRDALSARGFLASEAGSGSGQLWQALETGSAKGLFVSEEVRQLIRGWGRSRHGTHKKRGQGDPLACPSLSASSKESRRWQPLDSSLLSGLLLVGRVAWLIRIRGGFLQYVLELQTPGSSEGGTGEEGVVSEEQVRSAFEIADTDGDGLLTYSEALEAIQALAVGDSPLNEDPSTNPPTSLAAAVGLGVRSTPSLTYSELVLICGSQLLAIDNHRSLERSQLLLDQLVGLTHVCFAVGVVQQHSRGLQEAIAAELCFHHIQPSHSVRQEESMGGKQRLASEVKLFKLTWQSRWVDLDGPGSGDGDGFLTDSNRECLLVPSACTAAVAGFLCELNQQVAVSLVSVDCLQRLQVRLPPPHSGGGEEEVDMDGLLEEEGRVEKSEHSPLAALCAGVVPAAVEQQWFVSLFDLTSQLVIQLASHQVYSAYSHHLAQIKASPYKAASADILEEAALQVMFDLLVCQALTTAADRTESPPNPYRAFMAQWRTYLDPITAELMLPLLAEASATYATRTGLLYPSLGHANPPTPLGTATGDTPHLKNPSSPEVLLQAVFPQQQSRPSSSSSSTSSASSSSSSFTVRFALLPLAISTQPTPLTATNADNATTASSSSTSSKPSGGLKTETAPNKQSSSKWFFS